MSEYQGGGGESFWVFFGKVVGISGKLVEIQKKNMLR
jgi:hypothetical protein